MTITNKELAKKLGLSESAISLALNNKPGVSTRTRKMVLKAAEEYGYDFSKLPAFENRPEPQGSICFIIYRKNGAVVADTPFFSQLSEGIDQGCKRLNYFLNIKYIYGEDDIEDQLNTLARIGTKGIILLGTEMEKQDLAPFFKCDIPFVLLDNYFEDLDVDSILINNIKGAYTATDYLIKKRKKQPGYLHSSFHINNFEERGDGFFKAIRRNGMSTSRSIVHELSPSLEGAYADMREYLKNGEPIADCYFADNDLIAAGAMRAFKEAGYRIPQDIAIIGFDDMPLCTYVEPPLSTVLVPKEYMGKQAVYRLHEIISDGTNPTTKIEVTAKLVKRKSS